MEKKQTLVFSVMIGFAIVLLLAGIYLILTTGKISSAMMFVVIAMMLLVVGNSVRMKSPK